MRRIQLVLVEIDPADIDTYWWMDFTAGLLVLAAAGHGQHLPDQGG